MRTFEIIIALIVAALVFVAFKILGLLLKFALIAAVLGFVAGLVIARLFRR
jgi:membrane associated rhomboid family serine protease